LHNRPDWWLPDTGIYSWVRAGDYERLGHRRGGQFGALVMWVGMVYLIFGFVIYSASKNPAAGGFAKVAVEMFTADQLPHGLEILRHLFAALTGGVAYVAAISLDGTLRTNVWHPLSRRRHATTVFLSHLRQNSIFAVLVVVGSGLLMVICSNIAGVLPGAGAFRAFFMPAVFAFLLMPIPQALFPHGPDAFHRRLNPLKQLGAGAFGAGLALLTIYWSLHWPMAGWPEKMPFWLRCAELLFFAMVIQGGYYVWVHRRYARADLRLRIA
jgi:hypothetical protein